MNETGIDPVASNNVNVAAWQQMVEKPAGQAEWADSEWFLTWLQLAHH